MTHACSAAAGVSRFATRCAKHARTDLAVVLEQREQELVLAREAPVERLQRQPRLRRDLRDGEVGAGRLGRELTGRRDAALHSLDVAGPRVGQRPVERAVLPAEPRLGLPGIGIGRWGERHSPSIIGRETLPRKPRPLERALPRAHDVGPGAQVRSGGQVRWSIGTYLRSVGPV